MSNNKPIAVFSPDCDGTGNELKNIFAFAPGGASSVASPSAEGPIGRPTNRKLGHYNDYRERWISQYFFLYPKCFLSLAMRAR